MISEIGLIKDVVVCRLDAALANDLAGLRILVGVGLELALADLAEEAEELAAECALRIAPRRLPLDLEPREEAGPLLEVRRQGGEVSAELLLQKLASVQVQG